MIDEGQLYGRGIGFPPRIAADGRMAWSEGSQNISESIRIILLTEAQERLMLPEFGGGLQRFLFEPNTVATRRLIEDQITRALGLWEPRIELESVSVEPDPADEQAAIASINYKLVATQTSERLNLTVQLAV